MGNKTFLWKLNQVWEHLIFLTACSTFSQKYSFSLAPLMTSDFSNSCGGKNQEKHPMKWPEAGVAGVENVLGDVIKS